MTEEAKNTEMFSNAIELAQELSYYLKRASDGVEYLHAKLKHAVDTIESLSAQLEQVTNERDGLNIMLAQAHAMLETRTKERDAAVADLKEELRNQSVISLCENCRCKPEGDYVPNDCMDCVNGCNWQWRGAEVTNDAQKGSDAKS